MPLGHLLAEFSNSPTGGGWIHSVNFSADGKRLAWVGTTSQSIKLNKLTNKRFSQVGHDSSIAVANSGLAMMKLKTDLLPLLTGLTGNFSHVSLFLFCPSDLDIRVHPASWRA